MAKSPRLAAGRARALGVATRGTTNPNRLRRMDRWIGATLGPSLRQRTDPLVIDLGYGATPITTIELAARLPGTRVLGLEIDPERVAAAQASAAPPALEFARGGFELAGRRPDLVRVANVLRQYDEQAVAGAWAAMQAALAPGGTIVEGTCDEIGRLASWVRLDATGPLSLTLAASLEHLGRPSDLAPRLPKALIHRNVSGEAVNALLHEADAAWDAAAPLAVFGARQRWVAMAESLAERWPLLDRRPRWRHGELTVAWSAVAPRGTGSGGG
nr:SAM-dependent methyltransferase [Jatrophihabitans sp. GAS493]